MKQLQLILATLCLAACGAAQGRGDPVSEMAALRHGGRGSFGEIH